MAFNPPIVDNEIPSAAKWNTAVGRYDVATGAVDVVSTTTETSIYSKAIGAGHMSTDRMLRLTISGDILDNVASTGTFRIKLGGVELYERGIGFSASATRRPYTLVVEIMNLGAANSQWLAGRFFESVTDLPATGLGGGVGVARTFSGTGTIDTTAAATLDVTVQWAASSASLSWRKHYAVLELL